MHIAGSDSLQYALRSLLHCTMQIALCKVGFDGGLMESAGGVLGFDGECWWSDGGVLVGYWGLRIAKWPALCARVLRSADVRQGHFALCDFLCFLIIIIATY
jgi:hypothetical protein